MYSQLRSVEVRTPRVRFCKCCAGSYFTSSLLCLHIRFGDRIYKVIDNNAYDVRNLDQIIQDTYNISILLSLP